MLWAILVYAIQVCVACISYFLYVFCVFVIVCVWLYARTFDISFNGSLLLVSCKHYMSRPETADTCHERFVTLTGRRSWCARDAFVHFQRICIVDIARAVKCILRFTLTNELIVPVICNRWSFLITFQQHEKFLQLNFILYESLNVRSKQWFWVHNTLLLSLFTFFLLKI